MLDKLIDINSNSLLESQIHKINRELQGISPKIDVLIDQMANKNISDAMFKKLMNQYEQKQLELSEKLTEQKAELSAIKDRVYIEELDRETIVELIDYIEVFKERETSE